MSGIDFVLYGSLIMQIVLSVLAVWFVYIGSKSPKKIRNMFLAFLINNAVFILWTIVVCVIIALGDPIVGLMLLPLGCCGFLVVCLLLHKEKL